jgi:hypothetical protein
MWRAFIWDEDRREWRLIGSSRERWVLEKLYPEAEIIGF